jgi:hypothetical protein
MEENQPSRVRDLLATVDRGEITNEQFTERLQSLDERELRELGDELMKRLRGRLDNSEPV